MKIAGKIDSGHGIGSGLCRVPKREIRSVPSLEKRQRQSEKAEMTGYFAELLEEHIAEYFPGEKLSRKIIKERAEGACRELSHKDISVAQAMDNALYYLFYTYEESAADRIKSELWMQACCGRSGRESILLPEDDLQRCSMELSLRLRDFITGYRPDRDREAWVERCGVREHVREYLDARYCSCR